MKEKLIQNGIAIRPSPIHGLGIFAEKLIKKDEIVEESRILFAEGNDKGLENYYFEVEGQTVFLAGSGALYNHSDQPNVVYYFDVERQIAVFTAKQVIQPGEELFITYGSGWFSSREIEIAKNSSWPRKLDSKFSLSVRALLACGAALAIVQLLSFLR